MQLLRVSQSFRSIIKKAHSLSSTAFEQRGTGKNRNTAVASVHRSIMLNITSTHQKKKNGCSIVTPHKLLQRLEPPRRTQAFEKSKVTACASLMR